jgi:hypothetical protein
VIKKFLNSKRLVYILLALFLFLRLLGQFTDFSNSDAQRWHVRSDDFFEGLRSGNLKETYQRYHPGVTLMWISTAAQVGIKTYAAISGTPYRSIGNVEGYILHDGVSKTIIVIILAGLLLTQFRFLGALFDAKTALIYVLIVALEPYLVGIDRWYHLTSLETYLSFTAFLAVLKWRQSRNNKNLALGGLLLGFSLLTRFTSVVVLGILVSIVLYSGLTNRQAGNTVKSLAGSLAWLILPAIFAVIVFFPALWVAPLYVIQKILGAGSSAVAGEYQSVQFAQRYPLLFYPAILLLKLAPVTIVLLVLSLAKFIGRSEISLKLALFYIVPQLIIFTAANQKIERYFILLAPVIFLLISRYLAVIPIKRTVVFALILLVSNLVIYARYFPFPALYYNPIISGVNGAYKLGILDTNGEYFAQAANFLNQKGRQTSVYLPSNKQSFTPYFKGVLKGEFSADTQYVVVSVDSSRNVENFPSCPETEKTYNVDGLDYLTILKCYE